MNIHHDLLSALKNSYSHWKGMEAFVHLPPLQNPPVLGMDTAVKVDLFYRGVLPPPREREQQFPSALHWEATENKDRFFLEDINIHISYRSVEKWEELWSGMESPEHPEDTYGLYRLQRGNVIWSQSEWIHGEKKRLEQLPPVFWNGLVKRLLPQLEHLVTDLGLAALGENRLGFLYAQGRFLEKMVEYIFALNRRFLSSPEEWEIHLAYMEVLPSGFQGYWETFLRESGVDPLKKWELAKHLVSSLWSLGMEPGSLKL